MTAQEVFDEHARRQSALLGKKVVTLYVRRGDHAKERVISMNPIPDRVNPIELLNVGFALDGNSATVSVDPYTYVSNAYQKHGDMPSISRFTPGGTLPGEWALTWSITKAVNDVERALVEWLTALGYEVKFG